MRQQDWPTRLIEFIESRRDMPFKWGENDCVMFAAGAYEAMTGEVLVVSTWDSALSAARILKKMGGMEAVADDYFDRTDEPQRGDIGVVDGEFFGVIYPPYVITPGEKRIVMNPLPCKVAWKVQ